MGERESRSILEKPRSMLEVAPKSIFDGHQSPSALLETPRSSGGINHSFGNVSVHPPAPLSPRAAEEDDGSFGASPWDTVTSNVVSGGVSILEAANPALQMARLGGQSLLGRAFAPLGLFSNLMTMNSTMNKEDKNIKDYVDYAAATTGAGSSAVGTMGLLEFGMNSAGMTGAGSALTSTAAALGALAGLAAAFAGGYAVGDALSVPLENHGKAAGMFGQDTSGEFHDLDENLSGSECAGDTGRWVHDKTGSNTLGALTTGFVGIGNAQLSSAHWVGGRLMDAGGFIGDLFDRFLGSLKNLE